MADDDVISQDPGWQYGNVLPLKTKLDAQGHITDFAPAIPGAVSGTINDLFALAKSSREITPGQNIPLNQLLALTALGTGAGLAAPKGALGIFAGQASKTADLDLLAQAKSMAEGKMNSHGIPAEPADIYKQTGWFQGADGHWRYEISDDTSAYQPGYARRSAISGLRSRGVTPDVDNTGFWTDPETIFDHPELYKAYPELNDLNVAVVPPGMMTRGAAGTYFNGQGINLNSSVAYDLDSGKSTLLHELQHGIQHIEGFSPGTNPDSIEQSVRKVLEKKVHDFDNGDISEPEYNYWTDVAAPLFKAKQAGVDWPYMGYKGAAGEVEARNVQSRMDMTPAQRQTFPPWTTESIRAKNQIPLKPKGSPKIVKAVPVDEDPFAGGGGLKVSPVDHNPFKEETE